MRRLRSCQVDFPPGELSLRDDDSMLRVEIISLDIGFRAVVRVKFLGVVVTGLMVIFRFCFFIEITVGIRLSLSRT